MPDREHERVSVSLGAATQELIFVAGPLLVAGLVYVSSADAAVLTTAAVGLAGTLLVVTSPPSRLWTAEPSRADWLGPLRSRSLRVLYGAVVPFRAGEELGTEVSAKFRPRGLAQQLSAEGLELSHWWTDPSHLYGLALIARDDDVSPAA